MLGAMWHPLLVGPGYDSFECVERPWLFVMRASVFSGAILIVVAIVRAVRGRRRTTLSVAVTGILLVAAGVLVFAVAAAHDYHLCNA